MKVGIFSHCTIDTIEIQETSYEQIGGAACYCSLTASNLGFDVELFTKFGNDFSQEVLRDKKISLINPISKIPTTRFLIKVTGDERKLFLTSSCESLENFSEKADCHIVSPVFDEISALLFNSLKKDSNFVFLDPQGFLRRIDSNNQIFLDYAKIDLSNVNGIKADPDELHYLTKSNGLDAMKTIQKHGIENILVTNKREISFLNKDKLYSINLPNLELYDTTGVGDIFVSTFCCTMLKEKDPLWALSFGGGSAQAALETKNVGLKKIPRKGAIENNAAYFYNQIKFKQV